MYFSLYSFRFLVISNFLPVIREDGMVFHIVYNTTYRSVSVAAHNLCVIEDRAVSFHRLPRAILQYLQRNTKVEAILYE